MSSRGKPHLTFSLEAPREPKLLLEQLVEGVLSGGLAGPGLAIERRDTDRLAFGSRIGGWAIPDHGEIVVTKTGQGRALEVRLWCSAARRRSFSKAAVVGGLGATIATLAFGWLLVVSMPSAAALAIATDILDWRAQRKALQQRIETFVANTAYLRAI
ncbi:MAG: hypothetical protein CSB49_00725 [Proteobacteria bacterium]|nr:MAG: hypothetical protein CSB49_00725 [Pseudomonadota bacterium]